MYCDPGMRAASRSFLSPASPDYRLDFAEKQNHGKPSSAALAAVRSWWYTGGVGFDTAADVTFLGTTGESSASGDLFGWLALVGFMGIVIGAVVRWRRAA